MESQMGIPLPAATQWELVEQAAAVLKPAFDQLIWQAAQGEVRHNDHTGMRILRLAREPSDKRTGIFTSGIVSLWQIERSRCSSPGGNMRVRTSPTCCSGARKRVRLSGCAMRYRKTRPS
jgi:hypothetical protein